MELKSGSRLANRFKVVGSLGCSAHGVTFLANDSDQNEKLVVIKPISRSIGSKQMRAIASRAHQASEVNHPLLAEFVGLFDTSDLFALCFEYIEGQTLEELLQASALSDSEITTLIYQQCLAIEELQSHGLFGLQAKLSNLIITPSGRVKFTDWVIPAELVVSPNIQESIFVAPEVKGGTRSTAQSDIYSLGIQALVLRNDKWSESYSRPSLDQILHKALQLDPSERYASVEEMKHDLTVLAERLNAWQPVSANSFIIFMTSYLLALLGFLY